MLETRRWELSGNLQLGLGSAHVLYRNLDGSSSKTPREFMVVTEPSISAHLRVFRWVGIGAGVDWRQSLFVPVAIQKELNGPVFHLRAKFFLGDLLQLVKHHEPLFTQQGMRAE